MFNSNPDRSSKRQFNQCFMKCIFWVFSLCPVKDLHNPRLIKVVYYNPLLNVKYLAVDLDSTSFCLISSSTLETAIELQKTDL